MSVPGPYADGCVILRLAAIYLLCLVPEGEFPLGRRSGNPAR